MIALDIRIRYLLLSTLLVLSFLNYFSNPLAYSDAIECLGLQCRPFTLVINVLSFTFLSAMMISMGILNKSIIIPTYWFIPVIILGGSLIIHDWYSKRIVKPRKDMITPPPDGYIPRIRRIILNFAILFIYLFLFIANFAADRVPVKSDKFLDVMFYSAFGSLKERPGAFLAGWLSFFGIITAIVNLYFAETFSTTKFNLPTSWRI